MRRREARAAGNGRTLNDEVPAIFDAVSMDEA